MAKSIIGDLYCLNVNDVESIGLLIRDIYEEHDDAINMSFVLIDFEGLSPNADNLNGFSLQMQVVDNIDDNYYHGYNIWLNTFQTMESINFVCNLEIIDLDLRISPISTISPINHLSRKFKEERKEKSPENLKIGMSEILKTKGNIK